MSTAKGRGGRHRRDRLVAGGHANLREQLGWKIGRAVEMPTDRLLRRSDCRSSRRYTVRGVRLAPRDSRVAAGPDRQHSAARPLPVDRVFSDRPKVPAAASVLASTNAPFCQTATLLPAGLPFSTGCETPAAIVNFRRAPSAPPAERVRNSSPFCTQVTTALPLPATATCGEVPPFTVVVYRLRADADRIILRKRALQHFSDTR